MIVFSIFMAASTTLSGQSTTQTLEQLIHQFNEGGASNDISKISPVLHNDFRVVFKNTAENQVQILDRATYLGLIEKKVFGGEDRKVIIESIQIDEGLMASVKTQQQGTKNTLHALKNFVFHDGKWLMTEEVVYMK